MGPRLRVVGLHNILRLLESFNHRVQFLCVELDLDVPDGSGGRVSFLGLRHGRKLQVHQHRRLLQRRKLLRGHDKAHRPVDVLERVGKEARRALDQRGADLAGAGLDRGVKRGGVRGERSGRKCSGSL